MKRPYQKCYTQENECKFGSSPDKFGTGYIATKKQIISI